jgi:hypothetical protein
LFELAKQISDTMINVIWLRLNEKVLLEQTSFEFVDLFQSFAINSYFCQVVTRLGWREDFTAGLRHDNNRTKWLKLARQLHLQLCQLRAHPWLQATLGFI